MAYHFLLTMIQVAFADASGYCKSLLYNGYPYMAMDVCMHGHDAIGYYSYKYECDESGNDAHVIYYDRSTCDDEHIWYNESNIIRNDLGPLYTTKCDTEIVCDFGISRQYNSTECTPSGVDYMNIPVVINNCVQYDDITKPELTTLDEKTKSFQTTCSTDGFAVHSYNSSECNEDSLIQVESQKDCTEIPSLFKGFAQKQFGSCPQTNHIRNTTSNASNYCKSILYNGIPMIPMDVCAVSKDDEVKYYGTMHQCDKNNQNVLISKYDGIDCHGAPSDVQNVTVDDMGDGYAFNCDSDLICDYAVGRDYGERDCKESDHGFSNVPVITNNCWNYSDVLYPERMSTMANGTVSFQMVCENNRFSVQYYSEPDCKGNVSVTHDEDQCSDLSSLYLDKFPSIQYMSCDSFDISHVSSYICNAAGNADELEFIHRSKELQCGESIIGYTLSPCDVHYYSLNVDSIEDYMSLSLDVCGSSFDSIIGFYDSNWAFIDECINNETGIQCTACEHGTLNKQNAMLNVKNILHNGSYFVSIEGKGVLDYGQYSISVQCEYPPTKAPTADPTYSTSYPTNYPTTIPSHSPTDHPTKAPTIEPSTEPSLYPTGVPSVEPTVHPTTNPTYSPTIYPTHIPSMPPSFLPTGYPSEDPSMEPTTAPTNVPSKNPSENPSSNPTSHPTVEPTRGPTVVPTFTATTNPSIGPTELPTERAAMSTMNANKENVNAVQLMSGSEMSPSKVFIIAFLVLIVVCCAMFMIRILVKKDQTFANERNKLKTSIGEGIPQEKEHWFN